MATLLLQDGSIIKGNSFGAIGAYEGEIVFNTSIVGYQEILTDPSYAGQIIVMTYPEIGNYGINNTDFESDKPALLGFVVKNVSQVESHYQSRDTLTQYLKSKNIVALDNIDTRSLVKKIREYGTMAAYITSSDLDVFQINEKLEKLNNFYTKKDIILDVSPKQKQPLFFFIKEGKNMSLIMTVKLIWLLLTTEQKKEY